MQHNNFKKDMDLLSEAYTESVFGTMMSYGHQHKQPEEDFEDVYSDEEVENVEVDIEVQERQTNKINVHKQEVIQNVRTSYNNDVREHLGFDLVDGDCSYLPCSLLAFVHYDGTFLEDAYKSWEDYTKGIAEVVDTSITADTRATYRDVLEEAAHYIRKTVLADTTDEFLELTEHISPNVLFSDEVVAEVAQVAASEPGETELQVVDQATGEVFARIPAKVLAAVNVDDY
tara:strand:+ start:1723 stop:2412 length:690 start_codon:yes stop_codon:yes gene_type:complete